MTPTPSKLVFRFINPQGRLTIATLIAIAVYVLTFRLETGLRISLAYDVSVASFLALHAYRINRITAEDIRDYYQDREPSNQFVIITAVLFSGLSLAGVGFMADISKNWTPLHQNIHTASPCWRSCCPGFCFMSSMRSIMPTGITTSTRTTRATRQEGIEFSQRRAARLLGFSLLLVHDRHVLPDLGCDRVQPFHAQNHSLPCRHFVPVRDRHPRPGNQHSLQ